MPVGFLGTLIGVERATTPPHRYPDNPEQVIAFNREVRRPFGPESRGAATEGSAGGEQTEQPLAFVRTKDLVSERPQLRHCDDTHHG